MKTTRRVLLATLAAPLVAPLSAKPASRAIQLKARRRYATAIIRNVGNESYLLFYDTPIKGYLDDTFDPMDLAPSITSLRPGEAIEVTINITIKLDLPENLVFSYMSKE